MSLRVAPVFVLLCLGTSLVYAQTASLTITASSATVHKSPTVAAPVIGHVSRGDVLTVTRDVGDWVKVAWPSDPSGVGYVRESLGTRRAVAGTAATAPAQIASSAPAARPVSRTAQGLASSQTIGSRSVSRLPAAVTRPRHVVGLGARLLGPSFGVGGSLRAWSPGWLGLQVDLNRFSATSAFATESMTTTQFAPSVLFKPTDLVSDYVWLRPYVGAGFAMYRATLTDPTIGLATSDSRTGIQFFGGAEFTTASLPSVGVSLDLGYRSFDSPFAGFDMGGTSFAIGAHWYLK